MHQSPGGALNRKHGRVWFESALFFPRKQLPVDDQHLSYDVLTSRLQSLKLISITIMGIIDIYESQIPCLSSVIDLQRKVQKEKLRFSSDTNQFLLYQTLKAVGPFVAQKLVSKCKLMVSSLLKMLFYLYQFSDHDQVQSKANRANIARLGYIVQIWLYQYDPIGMWKFKISEYEIECSCFWKVDSYVSIINYHDFVKC